MRRTLLALAAAASVAGATAYTPSQAQAAAWWVAPAIVAGAVGGLAIGAAVANQQYLDPRLPAASYPRSAGTVYVQPRSECYITREPIDGRMRRVEVCP
jgi:hypothetical protein